MVLYIRHSNIHTLQILYKLLVVSLIGKGGAEGLVGVQVIGHPSSSTIKILLRIVMYKSSHRQLRKFWLWRYQNILIFYLDERIEVTEAKNKVNFEIPWIELG